MILNLPAFLFALTPVISCSSFIVYIVQYLESRQNKCLFAFVIGHVLETLDDCLQFTARVSVDPRLMWDVIVKYYLNASLLLW